MTRGDAWGKHLLREKPSTENFDDEGYHVRYEDGYESWSPKDTFEKAYNIAETPVDRMQIEAEELNGRYVKLAIFIDSGKMDEVVNDIYNKCLLEMQCYTMFDYIRLLDTRIQRMQGSDGAKVRKMNFGMAIMALKAGYPIRRSGWNGKGLMVFKQVPAHIDSDIIPKMQSLPQSAKDLILKGKGFIDYTSQCLIYNENTGRIRCLLVTARRRQDGILVDSEGYAYARYAAYVRDKRELDLAGVPRDNLDFKARER